MCVLFKINKVCFKDSLVELIVSLKLNFFLKNNDNWNIYKIFSFDIFNKISLVTKYFYILFYIHNYKSICLKLVFICIRLTIIYITLNVQLLLMQQKNLMNLMKILIFLF